MTNEILKHKILKSYRMNDDDDVSTETLLAMITDDCECDILDVVDVLAECCEKEDEVTKMSVTDLTNLQVGNVNGFKFLICAGDNEDAEELAKRYARDAGLNGRLEVGEFKDVNIQFDCDHVVRKQQ